MGRRPGSKNKPKIVSSDSSTPSSGEIAGGLLAAILTEVAGKVINIVWDKAKNGIKNFRTRRKRHKKADVYVSNTPCDELYPTDKDRAEDVEMTAEGEYSVITPQMETDIAKIVGYSASSGHIPNKHTGVVECLFQKFDGEDLDSYISKLGKNDVTTENIKELVKIKLSSVPPALIGVMATGAIYVVSQYMKSSSLNDVSKQIEDIKEILTEGDKSKLKACFNDIKEICFQLSSGNDNDVERRLNDLKFKTDELREKYRELAAKVNIKVKTLFCTSKGELERWRDKLVKSYYKEYMMAALSAEYAYSLSVMMKICFLCRSNRNSEAQDYIDKVPKSDCDLGSHYAEHYHKIRTTVIHNIKQLEEKESINSDEECMETVQGIYRYFDNIEKAFRICQARLLPRLRIKLEDGNPVGVYAC